MFPNRSPQDYFNQGDPHTLTHPHTPSPGCTQPQTSHKPVCPLGGSRSAAIGETAHWTAPTVRPVPSSGPSYRLGAQESTYLEKWRREEVFEETLRSATQRPGVWECLQAASRADRKGGQILDLSQQKCTWAHSFTSLSVALSIGKVGHCPARDCTDAKSPTLVDAVQTAPPPQPPASQATWSSLLRAPVLGDIRIVL